MSKCSSTLRLRRYSYCTWYLFFRSDSMSGRRLSSALMRGVVTYCSPLVGRHHSDGGVLGLQDGRPIDDSDDLMAAIVDDDAAVIADVQGDVGTAPGLAHRGLRHRHGHQYVGGGEATFHHSLASVTGKRPLAGTGDQFERVLFHLLRELLGSSHSEGRFLFLSPEFIALRPNAPRVFIGDAGLWRR